MFEVKSFFKKNNEFIPAAEFDDVISDPDYIEGAIEISQWNKKILTIENWDYVDQLWCYFARGLKKVSQGKEFKTYLPDQPVEIFFKPDSSLKNVDIIVTVMSTSSISVDYEEFLREMTKEAREFFSYMKKLLPDTPENSYTSAEKDLEVVEKNLAK